MLLESHSRNKDSAYRMFSLKNLVKRVGLEGQLQLVPFFKCMCVYLVGAAVSGGEAAPGPLAVLGKCAPVLCLLAAVAARAAALPRAEAEYARLVALGLALSGLGDALLVWEDERGLVAGMLAFGAAHACYWRAFVRRGGGAAGRRGALVAAAAAALYCGGVAPRRGPLALGVPAYAALLAGAAWGGVGAPAPAARGAALFAVSDALLGYSLFVGPLPARRLLVMSTYYLGQLGIALSALRLRPPQTDSSPSPALPS